MKHFLIATAVLVACTAAFSQTPQTDVELPASINDCFKKQDTNLVVILPTAEEPKEVCERIKDYAHRAMRRPALFLEDTAALQQDLSQCFVITYGTLSGNLWIKQNLKHWPIVIAADKIVTDREFNGTGQRVIACWFNPANPAKPWLLYTAQNAEDVVGINGVFHGPAQFHVARQTQVLQNGFFSRHTGRWQAGMTPDFAFPPLTQEQMCQDFDRLQSIVEQVLPLREVNRQIYGVDIPAMFAQNRKQIATISRTDQFVDLIHRTIVSCQGSHFWINTPPKLDYYHGFVDEKAYDLAPRYAAYIYQKNKGNGFELPLLYFAGHYYTLHDLTCCGAAYPKGLKVLRCNGKTPDEIIAGMAQSGVPLRWDYQRKHFYSTEFIAHADDPHSSPTNATLRLELEQTNGSTRTLELSASQRATWQAPEPSRSPRVVLVNTNILYLRIPAMDPQLLDFYQQQFRQYQNKPIRKVVFDIRNNGGGSDSLWQNLLSLLVDRPIQVSTRLAVKQSQLNSQYLARHAFGKQLCLQGKSQKIRFLNNEEFQVLALSRSFPPAPNSLRLKCKFFVLSENIYSSAGTFMNLCKDSARLVSVGLPNSMILGCGIDPFAFSLPHSKLLFTIAPVLDLTDAKTAKDTHHNDVEVPITPSLDQLLDYYNTGEETPLEVRLNTHDPFFQRVLDLK